MQPKSPSSESSPGKGEDGRKCMLCGAGSAQRVIIFVEYQGKENYVCAGCLPMVIHGSH